MWTDHHATGPSRRAILGAVGGGFGLLPLRDLLARDLATSSTHAPRPGGLPGLPHHPPRATRVIFLYMPGGPSHVDLLDPKPRLAIDAGKPLPFDKPRLERTKTGNLLPSPWSFARHGSSGIEIGRAHV